MQKRVGLKQIAKEMGVDVSTVSRALRHDPRVRPETAEAIRQLANQLDYRPNAAARALRGGKTGRVAVLLSPPQVRFASPIFLELLATLDQRLRGVGRTLAVFAAQQRDEELGIVRMIVEDRLADAVVLGRTQQHDARVDYLMESGVPFVTFGRTSWTGRHSWVDIDYARAGAIAIEALAASNPDTISVLSAPEGQRFADSYVEGANEAAERLGLDPFTLHRVEMTDEAGEALGPQLFARGGRHAIACIQDSLAFGLYRAASREGIVIGRDVAVFGGQNFPGSEHTAPPLSTFSTEDSHVAALLADVVVHRLDNENGDVETQVVEPRPLLRNSHLLAD